MVNSLVNSYKEQQFNDCQYFIESVDTKLYKNYLDFVELGMDIQTIQKRIGNLYYRSMESLENDIELIEKNACKFNDVTSEICQSCMKVKEVLIFLVRNFTNSEECANKIAKSKKNIK